MTDISAQQAFSQAVSIYGARYNQSPKVHALVSSADWLSNQSGAFQGCYAFFDANGHLLWIGKASFGKTLRTRVRTRLRDTDSPWTPTIAFLQLVEVEEAFQASSLEEFLIRELRPRWTGVGRQASN